MLEPEPMQLWVRQLLDNNDEAQTKATLALYATVNVAVRKFVSDSSESSMWAHNSVFACERMRSHMHVRAHSCLGMRAHSLEVLCKNEQSVSSTL